MLGAVATLSVIRYWAAGFASGGDSGFTALEGLVRTVGAALFIAIWPWLFERAIGLTNLLSGTLLSSGITEKEVANLLEAGLGGAIAGLAVMTKTEVLLILLGGIFVIEALSVVIQVISFQTFRKRVFLMAPIHHHFELQAWSETKIILRFWIVAAACGAIGFTVYQLSIRG